MYKNILHLFLWIAGWCLSPIATQAQIAENFADGDFTSNPAWIGNTADWTINSAMQLQSNNTVANSTFYLSTANTLATTAEWDMYVQLAFNTSSANYVDAYLTASASDLTSAAITGYFVRIGNTDDEISLYRKDAGGAVVKLIDGVNSSLGSNNVMKIKVTRTSANMWTLQRDFSGTGASYFTEGVVTDATYTTSAYFGYLVKQSTPSFFQKHFFDDIEVKAYIPDLTPPTIQSLTVTSPNSLDVLFSEPVSASTASVPANYSANNGIGSPVAATPDLVNLALVHLVFASNFPGGTNNTLTINNVKDLAGNALTNGTGSFSFYIPQAFDVVIDEILSDPTPQVGLPKAEYIELKNVSGKSVDLKGWLVHTLSAVSSPIPSYILAPDSFLIITNVPDVSSFISYGRVIGLGPFPALSNNKGTTVWLTSKEGVVIHSVSYNDAWYQNEVKRDGGWSLEMIDTHNPCTGASNWIASTNLSGGTPGVRNSVDAPNPDQTAPALIRASATDSVTVLLTFSEPVDIAKGSTAGNYTVSDGINTPASSVAVSPTYNQVQLTLNTALARDKVYTVTASNISDCSGNVINAINSVKVGLSAIIDSTDMVINEVLFNPRPGGVDYVEVYNRSNKVIDLKDMYIAARSVSTNLLSGLVQVTPESVLLFPGDYYVLSENAIIVKQNYVAKNPDHFVDVVMPSFSNDEGIVVLLNAQGLVVDELHYFETWHFALIDNPEGISLERIDFNKPTQDKNNWHSAASTVGYGTPTYQNSQYRADLAVQGEVTVTPKVFSPDNDGFEDYTIVNYQVTDIGYVANITIFDAAGRPVRALAKNATLGRSGSFRWDGLNDKFNKVPVGAYIIYTEIFNLNGKRKTYKNTAVVGARF